MSLLKLSYNWIYTTSNDNEYILGLIIIILGLIILNFNLLKRKKDKFGDTSNNNDYDEKYDELLNNYIRPTINNTSDNFGISRDEIARRNAWAKLDGNQETIPVHTLNISNPLLDSYSSNSSVRPMNYSTIGDYATLDTLGNSLTDTLGGIPSNLGYTLLTEQLGTFNLGNNTYDNTASYKSYLNHKTLDGVSSGKIAGSGTGFSGKIMQDNRPLFMQKDFTGVANIFAPNIIIANAPLNDDGTPDISFQM